MKKPFSIQTRSCGVVLHPTSLPGRFGIGDLGPEAYKFADFLSGAGQTWWQTFPLGPTGYGYSPYQSLSVFAGNPLLISLEKLVSKGWLKQEEISPPTQFPMSRVDYDRVRKFKRACLIRAFARFENSKSSKELRRFNKFCSKNSKWLDDFAFFMAFKRENREAPWWEWEKDIRNRRKFALLRTRKRLQFQIRFQQFLQYQFFQQWTNLKEYCHSRGIGFIGDVPIFVAHDSADVWANPKLFHLDKNGRPTIIAGVPPDYFSKTGQRWGNPLYRWNLHKKSNYSWWIERFKMAFNLFDAVRLDHFIGYERFWAIPIKKKTAINGKWLPGPSSHFFKKVLKKLGPKEFIAEDLGQVTKKIWELRDEFGFPGMRVMQFAFGMNEEAKYHQPHHYPKNCLVYPGTHDNDTIVGWFKDKGTGSSTRSKSRIQEELKFAMEYMKTKGRGIHWDMIRLVMMSVANVALFMAQDLLGLGSQARMNRPGFPRGNWEWRLRPKELTQKILKRLYYLTKITGRLPSSAHQSKLIH